ncbi:MAG TPA: LLM class flavin-dependent oxidoreductase, partial [Candidatus Limnocylindrales bacterium]
MALKLGYKASAEQFPPRRLLDLAIAAERAGFESVWTSDHFQPWRHTDGHAPNALVWLGAAAQATQRVTLGTSVLTPTFRYNPAVVAQAFATLGCPRAGSGHPRRRDRRIAQRDPGRHRLAGAGRAVRAPAGIGHAHPAALSRGLRHLRGRVLPHPQRHDLRPTRRA